MNKALTPTFLIIILFRYINICSPFSIIPLSHLIPSKSSTKISSKSELDRRQFNEIAFAATGIGVSFLGTRENNKEDYGLWGILPIGPYKRKKTIMEEIGESKNSATLLSDAVAFARLLRRNVL